MNDIELPASVEAERTVLGAILLDNEVFSEARKLIDQNDFMLDSHRQIFNIIEEMLAHGKAVDLVTLLEEIIRAPELISIGGISYCASLLEGLPRKLSMKDYCRILKQKSNLRKLIIIGSEMVDRAVKCEPGVDIGRDAIKHIKAVFQSKQSE